MAKIAFAGLGVMGWPMARHLLAAGHELSVFNRTAEKARRFVADHGGTAHDSIAAAVQGVEALVLCVSKDADVRAVVTAAAPHLADGALVVDHSTISAATAQALAAEYPRLHLVDAPVSGGQSGAEAGQLAIMCGGTAEGFAQAQALVSVYAKQMVHIGPAGHGQLAKCVNQIAIAGVIQGLAEAMHFAMKAGLDTDAVLQAVSKGAAQSWQMDNRATTMVAGAFDFGFAVDLMRKDFGLVLSSAREIGASLPVTALVDQFYADVQKMGGGREDTSALIRRLS